jgi:hypothetical protein
MQQYLMFHFRMLFAQFSELFGVNERKSRAWLWQGNLVAGLRGHIAAVIGESAVWSARTRRLISARVLWTCPTKINC